MKLIVGLGNPGKDYEHTRHNIGFRVADELARRWDIDLSRRRFSGKCGSGRVQGTQVLLLKPETFMNLSGRAVREAMSFHKIEPADLLVIADDMALPLARLRLRPKGSPGGHNGLSSVASELGTEEWARLRIGIEWAEGGRMVGHVLGTFAEEETEPVARAVKKAADAAECWLIEGLPAAMNRFNRPEEQANE